MRVAILGAGAIALGSAAFLLQAGHDVVIWSPSGASTREMAQGAPLKASGKVEGIFSPRIARSCEEALDGQEVVLIALPANGHRTVMEAAAPHLREGQIVVISGHLSFGALYLSKLLSERGVDVPVAAWGTTVTTGRRTAPAEVLVRNIRSKVDLAAVPASAGEAVLAACTALFGDRFALRDDLMTIMLSNLNPQSHMAVALCNLTRMEQGEAWDQNANITDAVGRLMEAMDAERLAIASAFGLTVRSVREHYHFSFNVPMGPVGEMSRLLSERGSRINGPTTLETRYVLEDAPFGLHPTTILGRLVGRPAELHEAGLRMLSALYGRDFTTENDLLPHLGLDNLSVAELHRLVRDGYRREAAAQA